MSVPLLLPAGYATEPSGGNVYGRHLADRLDVQVQEVSPQVAPVLPATGPVLADSLVVSWWAETLMRSGARVVPLVHALFGTPGESELLASAPVVVATSEWTRRALDRPGVVVAHPGVDLSDPAPTRAAGDRLVCVGAVQRAKGQDVLIAALARIADVPWTCTVVGPVHDADFADELDKASADAGLAGRVRLVGPLPPAEVRAAYAGADLLVHPSRSETYGMVVTEALASGLPVVGTSVGGVPEALGHGGDGSVPGLLVPPDDPRALARALRRWLEEPRCRDRWRRAVAARRLTLPTWTTTASRVAAALRVAS